MTADAKPMRRVKVRACIVVDIDVPAEWGADSIDFYVRENSCPGTSAVGSEVEKQIARAIETGDASGFCWACPDGENAVMHIEADEERATRLAS